MNTYVYVYEDTFDPFDPNRNQMSNDDAHCSSEQLWFHRFLRKNATYVLVTTRSSESPAGPFSITTLGETIVSFVRLSKFDYRRILRECSPGHHQYQSEFHLV